MESKSISPMVENLKKTVEHLKILLSDPAPRVGLFIACNHLEFLVSVMLQENTKLPDRVKSMPSQSTKLWIAFELGIIEQDEFDHLNFLNRLRNKAVHEIDFKVSEQTVSNLKNQNFMKSLFDGRRNICTVNQKNYDKLNISEFNKLLHFTIYAFNSIYIEKYCGWNNLIVQTFTTSQQP